MIQPIKMADVAERMYCHYTNMANTPGVEPDAKTYYLMMQEYYLTMHTSLVPLEKIAGDVVNLIKQ